MIASDQKWGGEIGSSRNRRPADERRDRPGRPADHDVLGRRPLEPDRVDEHVTEEAGKRPQGRRPVDHDAQPEHAPEAEDVADHQRVARRDAPAGDRP
jgi:hypothetical protein